MNRSADRHDWRTNLLLTTGVIATVVMALLLAQFDTLQIRLQPTVAVVAKVTAISIPATPLPAIVVPSAVPTTSPTTQAAASVTPSRTASGLLPATLCGEVPAGWSIYEVQPGDSLLTLAALSGATVSQISRVNCIQNGMVVSGMHIYLPIRPPTPVPCGPPPWWVQVRVQPGDTLFRLALRHGTTVYTIMQANCLNSTNLAAGRLLYLPPLPATPIQPLPTLTASPTASATATPTAVFTPTATATLTASPTAVITLTTSTPTPTPVTATPSATATATATPTTSETPSPSTATSTPSATPTLVPATATATLAAPTATATPLSTTAPTETAVPTSTGG